MPLTPASRLGAYEIIAPLGAGGMGEVYRARDTRLKRDVAIKVLPQDVASSPERLARFEREATTVAGLNHPNIVVLHSIEEADGTRFLTMELVEGQSLDQSIAPGGLPVTRVVELGIAIADALAAAHEKGVVHRDLKPANVMLTKDGRVKVLDFGLAKLAAPGSGAETTQAATLTIAVSGEGHVVGTVPYMAPEQVRGESVDSRTDLFSLGVVLYELASGRRPFSGASPIDLMSSILRDAPEPLTSLRGDVPAELERIVGRCLEKNARERVQSSLDVGNELRRLRRELERGPAAAPVTPAVEKVASIAVLPLVNRSANAEDEYFSDGLTDELLNVLGKIKGIRVTARTSSFYFKGKDTTIAEIGKALDVATVLEGSVRKAGNRARVSVQLVRVADSSHLWSETYDRTLDDIFAMQDDIAQSVVKELRTTLLGDTADSDATGAAKAEVANAAKGRATDPEAQRLFLQGRYFADRFTRDDAQRAIELFRAAIEIEPTHAMAWAELSLTHAWQAGWAWAPQAEGYARAREAARRAIELEPSLEVGHAALGWVLLIGEWNWAAAEASYARALELAPHSTRALSGTGWLMRTLGRIDEAVTLFEQAAERDPLSSSAYSDLGTTYYYADRLELAERAFRKALELTPQRSETRSQFAMALLRMSRLDEALVQATSEPYHPFRWWSEAIVQHALGRTADSDRNLAEIEAQFADEGAYQIAQIYAARGDLDATFAWLSRAHAQNDGGFVYLLGDPLMEAARRDPRWQELLGKLGLSDTAARATRR